MMCLRQHDHLGREDTYLVGRIRGGRRKRRQVRVGVPDPGLTAVSGMAAVTELVDRLGVIGALDAAVGPIKQRDRGFGAGELLVGVAAAQVAGEDFLVGLDRQRADAAGQRLLPVPGLASTTAAGLARRLTDSQWIAVETGVARVTGRMLDRLPVARQARLTGTVTIDLDATDVEVYGRKKRGVAYNHQGQRVGRPHVATWAEIEAVLAAELLSGNDDPRAHAAELLLRALAALPEQARRGRVRLRADAGYFAGELARVAFLAGAEFAIGAKRIAPMWRLLDGISEQDWAEAIDMPGAQVAVADYRPDWWPAKTFLLIRRVRLEVSQISADPRSRRRRTLHPDQRALPLEELAEADTIHGYSFILTNLDVTRTRQSRRGRALVPAPHQHREHLPRQQTRRRAAAPTVGLYRGQHRLDVGRTAGRDHGRLVTPAHRHRRTRRPVVRLGHPRRQSHDRHPAASAYPHPGPARFPCRPTDPAAPTWSRTTRRNPRPTPKLSRTALTTGPQPDQDLGHREPGATPRDQATPTTRNTHPKINTTNR
jgi:hypothetical protein